MVEVDGEAAAEDSSSCKKDRAISSPSERAGPTSCMRREQDDS